MDESDLREILECPVCTQVPYKTKIVSCLAGHQICQTCYSKLTSEPKECPNGRCRYSSPPTQIRVLESLIRKAKIKLNCPNGGEGCLVEELKGVQLDEHVGECKFRRVHCPEADCQEEVILSLLDEHLADNPEDHNDTLFKKKESFRCSNIFLREVNFANPDCDWYTRNGFHDGIRFWRVFVKRANLWQTWLVMEASPKQAELWTFSLKIQNKTTGMLVETSAPVVPIDWSLVQILDSGSYLTMTTATVRKLAEKNEDASTRDDYKWTMSLEYSVQKR